MGLSRPCSHSARLLLRIHVVHSGRNCSCRRSGLRPAHPASSSWAERCHPTAESICKRSKRRGDLRAAMPAAGGATAAVAAAAQRHSLPRSTRLPLGAAGSGRQCSRQQRWPSDV